MMRTLYPEISPFHSFFLDADSVHRVYVEQSGNPAGVPVIFLHGGPCSGTKPEHRRYFDPERYHIVLLDQRGCGQSLPFGELAANTALDLVDDIERIRIRLRVERWLLFGGSWGATLALLYAQRFPEKVSGMVLRGVFLARAADMDWFLGNGANRIYPQAWQGLLDSVDAKEKQEVLPNLLSSVFGGDESLARRAAKGWQDWGGQVALGNEFIASAEPAGEREVLQVRMELHYARNRYFLSENQLLANCGGLSDIPCTIIHGQNDLTCPLEAGWALHRALPHAEYIVLPNAGHVARGEEMIGALVAAADRMAGLLG